MQTPPDPLQLHCARITKDSVKQVKNSKMLDVHGKTSFPRYAPAKLAGFQEMPVGKWQAQSVCSISLNGVHKQLKIELGTNNTP